MTDADHDATLAAIRDQLTHPLPIGTDYPPESENTMTDHTPGTGDVRAAYARAMRQAFIASTGEHLEEFDRWLAEHDRQTAERAWREGWVDRAGRGLAFGAQPLADPAPAINPYRQEQTDEH